MIAFASDSFTIYTAIIEIYMSRALQSISLLVRCKNNRNMLGMDVFSSFVYISQETFFFFFKNHRTDIVDYKNSSEIAM